jgi:hypothetical protein
MGSNLQQSRDITELSDVRIIRPDAAFPWFYYFCNHRDCRMNRYVIYKKYIDKGIIGINKHGRICIRSIKGDKELMKLRNILFKEAVN